MSYTQVLDSFSSMIEADLKKQFEQITVAGTEYHPFIGEVYEAVEEFVLRGGRRLGSSSIMMVYKGYTGNLDERIVKACSGVELYRHSILVHDDIVDTEDLRRGGKTIHKILGDRYDEHLGTGSAIFIGNMLYALAIRSVLGSGFEDRKLTDVVNLLSSDFKDINESQILDLLFEYKQPGVKEWEVMASRRAASLFRTSMLTGAILASAQTKDLKLLEEAARHIGFAFDIQDDIIDTFATKEQYGRDPCGDISKRKKPLHFVLALERDDRLSSMLGGKMLTAEKIKQVQDIIRDCGALEEAKAISRGHAKEAQRLISMTGMNEDAKEFFQSFISYVDESLDWYN